MGIEKIKLSIFKDNLNQHVEAFSHGSSLIQDLVPNQILEVLVDRQFEYTVKNLSFWKDWEYGKMEISDEFFITEVLGKYANTDKEVIILFDDCFKTGEVYMTTVKELILLKESLELDESLYEPFDHVFYFKKENVMILVHHEGKVITVDLASAW